MTIRHPVEQGRRSEDPPSEPLIDLQSRLVVAPMHGWSEETEELADAVIGYARDRLHLDPVPLDGSRSADELAAAAGRTITAGGLGGPEALRIFAEVLAPACISVDHPRYLSFIPCAPTEAATLFDLVVGASSIYGGSWLEGAGAVHAENEALRWIADIAGLPSRAGGVFVQGGTIANLSGLVAARHLARMARGRQAPRRWAVVASSEAHASIATAAAVMDVDLVTVEVGAGGKLTGEGVLGALEELETSAPGSEVFAVVASAGSTNLGIVDDLASVASVTGERRIWLHVDGAYGGAALAAPSARPLFAGVERADSLVVDPHKWLFAPFDCAALIYREPAVARAAHTQHAGYLEPILATGDWNPSDFAIHLTRRARGLPFWFSLATYGTDAYGAAVEHGLRTARYAAAGVTARSYLELVCEPELSVVGFYRKGWKQADYDAWSRRLREAGAALVTPTVVDGLPAARIAVVSPRTSDADIDLVLDSLG
jgi:L-2,4-diaminobutyrate decarboxylase